MLIHKHLIVTGHFDEVNKSCWPWPRLHDLNDELIKELDMKVLSDLIKSKITDKMDHKNLNLEVDFLKDVLVCIYRW